MSSPTPTKKAPKELSSELRMLLAFALMGIILVGSNWIYGKLGISTGPKTTPESAQKAEQKPDSKKAEPLPGSAQGSLPGQTAASPVDTVAAAPVSAANKQTWSVDTPLYNVVFSNEGA